MTAAWSPASDQARRSARGDTSMIRERADLNAASFSNGVTTGTITGIHAKLSGPGCSAVVDGTGASANNGKVTAKYSNSTGKLTTTGAGNLHIYKVSGCAGLIGSGDGSSFKGSYAISPKQTITSP